MFSVGQAILATGVCRVGGQAIVDLKWYRSGGLASTGAVLRCFRAAEARPSTGGREHSWPGFGRVNRLVAGKVSPPELIDVQSCPGIGHETVEGVPDFRLTVTVMSGPPSKWYVGGGVAYRGTRQATSVGWWDTLRPL